MKVLRINKYLILILGLIFSFDLSAKKNKEEKVYNRLSKLYKNDRDKCYHIANKMIDKNTTNYVAYIYVLKYELDTSNINVLDNLDELPPKKRYKKIIKNVRRLVKYAKIIEKNLDDEYKCKTGYLVDASILVRKIRAAGLLVAKYFPDSKESFIKHCKPICDFSYLTESGSSCSIKYSYGKTRFTVDTTFYLNGLPTGDENFLSSSLEEEMSFLRIINKSREEKGLHPLKLCEDLSRAARYHSYDMGTQNYFQHSSFDRQGKCGNLEKVASFSQRCKRFISAFRLAENTAAGNYGAEATFKQWYNSPGHYKNMFSDKYTYIGIGMIKVPNSTYTYYWTTDFR